MARTRYLITIAGTPPVEVALSRCQAAGVRRVCEVLNRAVPTGTAVMVVDRLEPREPASNQPTPEAAAAMDAQMRQMSWTGDV